VGGRGLSSCGVEAGAGGGGGVGEARALPPNRPQFCSDIDEGYFG